MSAQTKEPDIVEQLRRWLPPGGVTLDREDYDLFIAAADAITRLRAERPKATLWYWREAIEAAAKVIETKHTNNVGMIHPMAVSDAAAIRALTPPATR